MIDDQTAQMLEDVLRSCPRGRQLTLLLNSPGGDALAAERIINISRAHSNGKFGVIVPKMAKSAATMVCLGSSRIQMMTTAEVGAIDPQVVEVVHGEMKIVSARAVIDSYQKLMRQALKVPAENVSPLLQQLQSYDARTIAQYRNAVSLSEDIAVRALQTGMMQGLSGRAIRQRIKCFTAPKPGGAHGRGIGIEEARKCGLKVEEIKWETALSDMVWELYVRTNHYVSTLCSAAIETADQSFTAARPATKGDAG
jgi:hypothetical protein